MSMEFNSFSHSIHNAHEFVHHRSFLGQRSYNEYPGGLSARSIRLHEFTILHLYVFPRAQTLSIDANHFLIIFNFI